MRGPGHGGLTDRARRRAATALGAGLALLAAGLLAPAPPAAAQEARPPLPATTPATTPARADRATLIADRVYLAGDRVLTAEGAVEVFYRDARLQAPRIIYHGATDRLTIEGPMTLIDDRGTIVLADAADLSADLTEGVLIGARMMLEHQLQLAAVEVRRQDERYAQLSKVVVSSCRVCPHNPVPLWEIRSRRVVHDMRERQLYFDHAQFRVAGVPVFYLPRMRVPDPTVERATGFLVPVARTTSALGPGLKLPYFIALGPDKDLTVTPYYALDESKTLELRYRQAFRTGRIALEGAVSRDDIRPGDTRGYLFGTGEFALPRDFRLDLRFQAVTDRAYLLNYGVDGPGGTGVPGGTTATEGVSGANEIDRLASGAVLSRARRNEYLEARLFHFRSVRPGEDNDTLPSLVGDAEIRRRFAPDYLGGEAQLGFSVHAQGRNSDTDFDSDGDGLVDGRDLTRLSASIDWGRSWVLSNGMVASLGAQTVGDLYLISQDAGFDDSATRITPAASAELRWPWLRTGRRASDVIEPVVQLVWTPDDRRRVPNEDSQIVEFDEGNLFGFGRFPGSDRRELGTRLNLGMSWTRVDQAGWTLGVTGGRVLRARDLGQFSEGSGLAGLRSDWLVSGRFETAGGFSLMNRALFDDNLDFAKDELRLALDSARFDLATSYLWLDSDLAEGRPVPTSELAMQAGVQLTPFWRASASGRYDLEADEAARASFGLAYQNECATVALSLSRRFTDSATVNSSTDINLSVVLGGFGARPDSATPRRQCARY